MKMPKITFDHCFKTAIILCAVVFIYSNWNTGRYQPHPINDKSVLVSILDTNTGVFYFVSTDEKTKKPSTMKVDIINIDKQLKSKKK